MVLLDRYPDPAQEHPAHDEEHANRHERGDGFTDAVKVARGHGSGDGCPLTAGGCGVSFARSAEAGTSTQTRTRSHTSQGPKEMGMPYRYGHPAFDEHASQWYMSLISGA